LTLSQLGADRELPSLTDLTALLETLVDEFTDLGSHVALKDCKRVTAVVRPHQIMRAIRNLIENAIKFGSYARLSLIELEDELEIRVDDDGPGLPLSSVQALMAPFTRLEGSRNRMTGGAGLGLSIVHTIIEIHGGWLRFENRGSGGLRVRVGLRRQLIDKDAPRKRHLNPN
jgi:signal transduction histidine kinase